GRYGADKAPGSAGSTAFFGMPAPHISNQVDYDGRNNDGTPTAALPFADSGMGTGFSAFPAFPPGYGNGSPAELTNHPASFNFFQPSGDDRLFPISNMDALLRHGDTGASSLPSDLLKLSPNNFVDPHPDDPPIKQLVQRIRGMVTTHSFDVDRPGVMPWLWRSGPGGLQAPTTILMADVRFTGAPGSPQSLVAQ